MLINVTEKQVTAKDFYHDRALDCLFKLAKSGLDNEKIRKIRTILNVKDIGLCESYWKVIGDNVDTYLLKKLRLEDKLLIDSFKLYSDS